MPIMRCFYHLRFLSCGCIFFKKKKKPLLVIRMNLTVLWNNGDYSKAIKFLKMLFIPVTFTSHPLNTDDLCQRGINQHKWKDHQK